MNAKFEVGKSYSDLDDMNIIKVIKRNKASVKVRYEMPKTDVNKEITCKIKEGFKSGEYIETGFARINAWDCTDKKSSSIFK